MPDDDRLTDLRKDMRESFKNLDDKIDKLISRGEFEATVQRLDARHKVTEDDLAELKGTAEKEHALIRKEFMDRVEGFSKSIRWWVGIGMSVLAMFVTFISPVLRDWLFH